jgi:hypothetical protein
MAHERDMSNNASSRGSRAQYQVLTCDDTMNRTKNTKNVRHQMQNHAWKMVATRYTL